MTGRRVDDGSGRGSGSGSGSGGWGNRGRDGFTSRPAGEATKARMSQWEPLPAPLQP